MLTLNRNDFLQGYFDYRMGESLVIVSPTGAGKSHLAYQCLDVATRQNPELRVTTALPKPSDDTTYDWAEKLDFKVADSYPFQRWPWQAKPRGYVLHPPHIRGNEDANEEHLRGQFRRMLNDEYWRGHGVVLLDDCYRIVCGLKCGKEADKYLTEGRSNRVGLFATLQQPRGTVHSGSVSSFFYNQPTHLLFGKDGNQQNRERLAEIACGLDPRMIGDIVANLKTYRIGDSAVSDFLYLNRTGPYLAVVTPF